MSNSERTRDHLANERTFLAWLRTALAILALGALLLRLDTKDTTTDAAGGIVIAAGVLVLLYGARRYETVMHALRHDVEPPPDRSPVIVTVGVLVALAAVIPLLLA